MCKKSINLVSFVLVLCLFLTNVADAADPNLVGWWRFDEGRGTTALDRSGYDNHGTLVGNPRWVTGYRGGALALDGSNWVDCGNPPQLQITTAITIACWINPAALGGERGFVGRNAAYTFKASNTRLRFTTPGIRDHTGNNSILEVGIWQHAAVTFLPGKSGGLVFYINGVETDRLDSSSMNPGTGPFRIGTNQWNEAYIGLIDDVRVYNKVLTKEEIKQAMKGVPLGSASNPSPANEAIDIPRDVVLSWMPGEFANTHDVYFGTVFSDVNSASRTNPRNVLASSNQSGNSYDPAGLLDFSQTYYWRVDEVNAPPDFTIFKGDVWQFTVEPIAYPIAGTLITATSSSQFNTNTKPENTINDSGLDAADLHSTAETSVWLSSMTGPQPTWIQYEFDKVYKLHQMWVWNYNASIEPVVGFGFKEVTIEYSTNGTDWAVLADVPQFARAPGTAGYAYNTTVDLSSVVAKYIKLAANSNWGGMVPQYGLSEVRFFYVPVMTREPNPASGATGISVDNVTLGWRAGREAAKHNVYLSDSNQAVIEGTAPVTTVSQASYGPLSFDLGKAYYWRVDEVNEAETPAIWQGDVLNFTTREFLVVDDFEDYNDFEPDRIFDTWVDGWADPANGSQVGYANPPFAEKTIIHGGKQSMPLSYDNSTTASYSEAAANVANLPVGKDWTKYGIKTLSLWFRGDPNNAAERMYVKLNGSKVIYDGDADGLRRTAWQPWNIELSAFGGLSINLRNVTELIIGFERSGAVGGKGVVYFDDIRLYPYSRQLITPAEPSSASLAGYWQFEGNLNDSSGNNRHGAGVGNPTFAAGKVGQAVNLTGSNYVVITGYKGILGGGAFSIAAWVKTGGNGTMVNWGTQAGGQRVDFRLDQGRLRIEHSNGNLQGNTVLADGQWHHVALTVSENAPLSYPAVRLYLDGNDDSQTTTDPDTFNIVANIDVNIGRRGTNNDRVFSGSLDEVRIYERVLSQDEIAWLAGRTKPFDKPF